MGFFEVFGLVVAFVLAVVWKIPRTMFCLIVPVLLGWAPGIIIFATIVGFIFDAWREEL